MGEPARGAALRTGGVTDRRGDVLALLDFEVPELEVPGDSGMRLGKATTVGVVLEVVQPTVGPAETLAGRRQRPAAALVGERRMLTRRGP